MSDLKQEDLHNVQLNCIENVYAYLKRAYQRGYQRGRKDGLKDAWECARKIILERQDDYTVADTISIFSCNKRDVILRFSASEAIAKIKEYEEKQNVDIKKNNSDH